MQSWQKLFCDTRPGHSARRRQYADYRTFAIAAALCALTVGASAKSASSPCSAQTGEARRVCIHDEVVARTAQNRAAADAARTARQAQAQQATDRASSNLAPTATRTGTDGPVNSWMHKPVLAQPHRGNESYNASEARNKLEAVNWVNSNSPDYLRLRTAIERLFPLWAHAEAINIAPDSFAINPGRFAGELNVSYAINLANGKIYKNTLQAQTVNGQLCLGYADTLYRFCDDLPSSQADADRLYAARLVSNVKAQQDAAREQQEAAAVIAGSRTRRPGSPLNAEDEACMSTLTETYQSWEQTDTCLSGYETGSGPTRQHICTKNATVLATHQRNYEKNICKRPIKFRDQCGSTIWGSYTVAPGARFDRKFSAPCGRIY